MRPDDEKKSFTPGRASNSEDQPTVAEVNSLVDTLQAKNESSPYNFAQDLLADKKYLTDLRIRLRERTLAPALELELWRHRFGKPADTVRIAGHDGGPVKMIELRIVDPSSE